MINLHPEIRDFFQIGDSPLDTGILPAGIYQFTRRCFFIPNMYQTGLIEIYERHSRKFSRGFMARAVARHLGLNPNSRVDREYRGAVFGVDRGVVSQAAHLGSKACSFTFLDRVSIVERTFLMGYCARTMPGSGQIQPVSRVIYEKVPNNIGAALQAGRRAGFRKSDDLPKFIRDLLADEILSYPPEG